MNKQFLAVIIVVILALAGIFAVTNKKDNNTDNKGSSSAQPSENITGLKDSKVTLVEYGDFQCPACKSYFPLVTQLKETYGDRVAFQFRNFPLVQIHPNAFVGARAAEAAAKQGKFFEMHDLLYENQETWSTSSSPATQLQGYAQQLGLNIDQFNTDMNSSAVADIINADVKSGQAAGVSSTPTFLINGKKIEKSPQSIDEFKTLLDEALKNSQQ